MSKQDKTNLMAEDFQHALQELGSYVDVTVDDLMQINQMALRHAELREAEQVLVGDVMSTDVISVTAETSLRDAARKLLELRISGLPVLDDKDRLIGVVTEADFLAALGIPYHHPAHSVWQTLETLFRYTPRPSAIPARIGEIMKSDVVTITAEASLSDAIDTMKRHHVKRLIVCDPERRVIGVLTRSNLIQVLLQTIL